MQADVTNADKPDAVFIIEFRQAYAYLLTQFGDMENNQEYLDALLRLAVEETMNYANHFNESNALERMVDELMDKAQFRGLPQHQAQEIAFDVAKHTQDFVSHHLTALIPMFSLHTFANKYNYEFIGGPYGRIQFNYWQNGVPPGKSLWNVGAARSSV